MRNKLATLLLLLLALPGTVLAQGPINPPPTTPNYFQLNTRSSGQVPTPPNGSRTYYFNGTALYEKLPNGTSAAISGGSTGTVTSVGLSLGGGIFTVTGSPVTTTGTLTGTLATQTANFGFFGPASGSAAAPTFRALVPLDIPTLTVSKLSDYTSATNALIAAATINTSQITGFNAAVDARITSPAIITALGYTPENLALKNAASGYAGLSAGSKLALAQGQEVWGLVDLSDVAATSGSGTTIFKGTVTSPASGDVPTWNGSNWVNQAPSASGVTGSGTANRYSIFTGSGTIGNSILTESSNQIQIGIAGASPSSQTIRGIDATTGNTGDLILKLGSNGTGSTTYPAIRFNSAATTNGFMAAVYGNNTDSTFVLYSGTTTNTSSSWNGIELFADSTTDYIRNNGSTNNRQLRIGTWTGNSSAVALMVGGSVKYFVGASDFSTAGQETQNLGTASNAWLATYSRSFQLGTSGNFDTSLTRDGTGIMALSGGGSTTALRVYTVTGTNLERASLSFDGTRYVLASEFAAAGTARNLRLNVPTGKSLLFAVNSTDVAAVTSSGLDVGANILQLGSAVGTTDASISRLASGILQVGTGAANSLGTVQAANFTFGTALSDVAPSSLTVRSQNAFASASSNKTGGALILAPGTGTGAADASGPITFQTAAAGAGTTLTKKLELSAAGTLTAYNAGGASLWSIAVNGIISSLNQDLYLTTDATNRAVHIGSNAAATVNVAPASVQTGINTKALSTDDVTATNFVRVDIASGAYVGGYVAYTVTATDGTEFQSRSGSIPFSMVNKGGTESATFGTATDAPGASSGTLTLTWSVDTSPTNGVNFAVVPVSTLTQTGTSIRYIVYVTSTTAGNSPVGVNAL